jgi:hypothetical protein
MHDDPTEYIRSHLAHVLDQMFTAATTWSACHPDRGADLPVDLVIMAEYSAFLHERCLYELACQPKGKSFRAQVLGSGTALTSPLQLRWYDHLNAAVLHVYRRGIEPDPVVDGDHLKDQVADLARDVYSLYRRIESELPKPERRAMSVALASAQRKSDRVADSFGIATIGWDAADPFAGWGRAKWWPTDG